MVAEVGLEPTRSCDQRILLTTSAFAALSVCGLDYSFTYTVADYSLCTFSFQNLAQDWHFKAFLEFTAYYYIVSNITTHLSPLWLPLHHYAIVGKDLFVVYLFLKIFQDKV